MRDLLFPFLFILAMEGLNNIIKDHKINGLISGFEVPTNSGDNLDVDDTLIFCGAEEEQLRYVRVITL